MRRPRPFLVVVGVAGLAALAGVVASLRGGKGGRMSVRDIVVGEAQKAVGLNASTRATEFESFLGGPGETSAMSHDMALAPQSSTCELTARAIYRNAGFKHPSLFAPYATGSGIWPLAQDAKAKGAWVDGAEAAKTGELPGPGDIVGGDFPSKTAHVWTIETVDPVTKTFTSVDGGVKDGQGHQSVAARTRHWTIEGGQIKDHPNIGNVHTVTGWINVEKYAAATGWTPPSGAVV